MDLNKILKIVINQAEKAGCEPNRINPEIKINDRSSSFWGRCKWNPNEKWYDIELTKRLLSTDVYSITNTIAHRLDILANKLMEENELSGQAICELMSGNVQ